MNRSITFILALLLLAPGCAPALPPETSRPPATSPPQKINSPARPPQAIPLAWEIGHPERRAWSDELRRAVAASLPALEQATDVSRFAPNYTALSPSRRIEVWAALFVAIARFESGYDPHNVYREPFGQDSVGLLQLSYEDQAAYRLEPLDRRAKSLEDPLVNLRCGVKILARLVRRDGLIAAGTSLKDARGGARYWSTLWPGPRHHLADILAQTNRVVPYLIR
jgi:soluble lytic murein transglycosylase-like protein